MKMLNRRSLLRLAACLALPTLPRTSHAGGDPAAPVRVVVGFPPGGPVDIAARLIGPMLSTRLQQPFVVENVPGESGNLATSRVVSSQPDRQTLLLCGPVNTINTITPAVVLANSRLDMPATAPRNTSASSCSSQWRGSTLPLFLTWARHPRWKSCSQATGHDV